MPKSRIGGRTVSSGGGGGGGPINFTPFSDNDAAQLRQLQDSAYNGTVTAAVKMYISGQPGTNAANVDGLGHSMSQVLNHILESGGDIQTMDLATANQLTGGRMDARTLVSLKYIDGYMQTGAHAIGKDTILTRAAHANVLATNFGLSNWNNMTEAQLKAKLVGGTFSNKGYMSTSYDASKSPFLNRSSGISGGREVIFRINTPSNTNVLLGNKAQAEVILAKGQNFRIRDVSYTGVTATPRTGRATKQIYVDLDII